MRALVVIIVALLLAAAYLKAEAPLYTAQSIVNAADNQSGALAPNTLATIYGQNLASGTQALSPNDIQGGTLPTIFPGTGVHVVIGNLVANLIYVSPTQINFLVPPNLIPATLNLQVVVDGWAGPAIPIQLAAAAPGLFQLDAQNVIATEADGALITPQAPAKPGDVIVLYATGLGQTTPPVVYSLIPNAAASIIGIASFTVSLDGVAVDPSAILYAGVAPGFGGLYQINLTLPASVGANPQILVAAAGSLSAAGVTLPVQP
ncbi:MAG TPA: IPT/TIG domain-containing protein [Bryobacteraceae bacterium]|nr:IPT/TIG domain-containing protein [Bryobacteraceae bacterium]